MTALRRRDLLHHLIDTAGEVDEPPGTGTAPPQDAQAPDRPVCAAGDPAFDYFGSFAACHTLLAEIRPLLDAEIVRLGLNTAGKTDWQIAREVFAFQPPPPGRSAAAPGRDAAARPSATAQPPATPPGGHRRKEE